MVGIAVTVTVVVIGIPSLATLSTGIIITNIADRDYVKISTICPVAADDAAIGKPLVRAKSIMRI